MARTSRRRTSRYPLRSNAGGTQRGKARRITNKSLKNLAKKAKNQGWTVDWTHGGHLRFTPPDLARDIVIAGGTPSDYRAIKNLELQLRRSGLQPNIAYESLGVPIPGRRGQRLSDPNRNLDPKFLAWLRRTFAVGTPVKILGGWYDSNTAKVPVAAGARAVVIGEPERGPVVPVVPIEVVDARDASGMTLPAAIGREIHEPFTSLEPLVDNWLTSTQPRSIPRHLLPHSQQARLKPNPLFEIGQQLPPGFDHPPFAVGDALVLERHPIYESSARHAEYRETRKRLRSIEAGTDGLGHTVYLVRLFGSKRWFRLQRIQRGGVTGGWGLWSGPPRPLRYEIIEYEPG